MTAFRDFCFASDPEVFEAIAGEELRQQQGINLIPSENYTYPEVLAALGSVLTNKYCEGYPGRRYYAGQEFSDRLENLARERACRLFRAEHANVQPLSGSPMNQAVYLAFMKPGDTILGMDLSHGGHLTHGAPVSHMGQLFNFVRYKTEPGRAGAIDFEEVRRLALEARPKIVLCGYTSYPRDYDYSAFRSIATEVGALAMADISHVAGMIAADVLPNPLDAGFDIVTTTTHKSLRGPRGGMILCRKELAKQIDSSVFPGLQGGPHMNSIAAAAITFRKAEESSFKSYARQILKNARALGEGLSAAGVALVTGGTSNHMLVADTIASYGMDGKRRRADAGEDRHRHQQAGDSRRPESSAAAERNSPGHAGLHDARDDGSGDAADRFMDRRSSLRIPAMKLQIERIAGEVRTLSAKFPIPGFDSLPW